MNPLLNKKTLNDVELKNKKVLVRLDLNVPIKNGKVVDPKRIVAALPTLQMLINNNCKIIILSHLGRIKTLDDKLSNKKSLAPVAKELQLLLPNNKISFLNENTGDSVINAVNELNHGEIIVLENTRYNDVNENNEIVNGESKNNPSLGKFWASLADVFVNDAFGTAHRAHASNVGIAENIKISCIGYLIELELKNLEKIINPQKPFITILGGSKISDKLKVVKNLIKIADYLLIGGGMAFTFLKALEYDVGKSIVEEEMVEEVKKLLADNNKKLIIANDENCATTFANEPCQYRTAEEGFNNLMALDIGKRTIADFGKIIENAKTIFWNGPMGVYEFSNYQNGTASICAFLKEATKNGTFTLIGGGDSAAAAVSLGFNENDFSFISTGGGASLELIEGKPLPGITSIQEK